MGLRQRLRTWLGGRSGEPPTPGQREAAERRELDQLQRAIDEVHGRLRDELFRLSSEAGDAGSVPPPFAALAEEVGSAPPRFATREEAREYLKRVRALLRG